MFWCAQLDNGGGLCPLPSLATPPPTRLLRDVRVIQMLYHPATRMTTHVLNPYTLWRESSTGDMFV